MCPTINERRGGGVCKTDGESREATDGPMAKRTVVYPWITEARGILADICPCSKDDAAAVLVSKMTTRAMETAMRDRTRSYVVVARQIISRLCNTGSFRVKDGIIEYDGTRTRCTGTTVLETLKAKGRISEVDTGFTQDTARTYRFILKKMSWIQVEGKDWLWIGPDSADWAEVNTGRRRGTRQRTGVR